MDPVLVVMIAQTVVFTITLFILNRQVAAQVSAVRWNVYSKCSEDYSALIRMLVEKGDLQTIYDDLDNLVPDQSNWSKYSKRQRTLYNYMELNYELFDRVFHLKTMGWIDKEMWGYWEKWLTLLSVHPIFKDVAEDCQGMFQKEFEKYVAEKIANTNKKAPSSTNSVQ